MARNISFNGNSLQTDHILTSDIDDHGIPDKNLSILELAHANRSKIPYESYPSRTIHVGGVIIGDSVADLDNRLDAFKLALSGVDKNLDVDYGVGTRRYTATLKTMPVIRPGGLLFATFDITFICTNPFGRDATPTTLCDFRSKQLISNGSFGTSVAGNTTGWSSYNGAAIAKVNFTGVTEVPGASASAMQLTTTGSGANALQGASFTAVTVVIGNTYTFSMYVKGTAGQTFRIRLTDSGGDTDSTGTLVATGVYQRISVSKTAASTSMTPTVIIEAGNTSVKVMTWDEALMELGTSPSNIFDQSARSTLAPNDSFIFGGTAPWQQPVIAMTINSGSTLTGSVQIGNNTNGQAVTVTRTFSIGDILVIDSYLKSVTINGVDTDFTGAFPEFPPGVGVIGLSTSLVVVYNYKITVNPAYL